MSEIITCATEVDGNERHVFDYVADGGRCSCGAMMVSVSEAGVTTIQRVDDSTGQLNLAQPQRL